MITQDDFVENLAENLARLFAPPPPQGGVLGPDRIEETVESSENGGRRFELVTLPDGRRGREQVDTMREIRTVVTRRLIGVECYG
jgi:hypothetical protein